MSYYKNLVPGQWQIGDIVFGRGTNIRVETVDVKPYDVNAQDYQVAQSDEIRFGLDSHKPTTIEITMEVLHDRLLPGFEGVIPNFWHSMPTINDVAREWRGDDVRRIAGQMKPLYACSKLDGIPKVIYGRPGQCAITADDEFNQGEVVKVVTEFRRGDTLAYSVQESGHELEISSDPVYLVRDAGDGPDTWLRLILYGPLTHPIITIGTQQVELDLTIPTGVVVEVSSYPWQRRIVDSNRIDRANSLIGVTQYLDKLRLPYRVPVALKWTSDEVNTWVPALNNSRWAEDIEGRDLFQLPDTFTSIHGTASVYFDLFNFGSTSFPWLTPRFYLSPSIFSDQAAIIYNAKKYNTTSQYAEAQLVNPTIGKSGIVIMSTTTMTGGFVVATVEVTLTGNFLRIYSGTAYNNLTQRASWQNLSLLGWLETDKVGIGYDPDTKTYTAYLNGDAKCSWNDSTDIVPTDSTHRSQGFLFDIDGNLLTLGIGFTNIIAYDTLLEPPQGRVLLLWRDSYTVI